MGDKYKCIKDFVMDTGKVTFIKGKTYEELEKPSTMLEPDGSEYILYRFRNEEGNDHFLEDEDIDNHFREEHFLFEEEVNDG